MFTARPVRTAAGQIILDEGCLLSAQTILHIRDYSIPEVWIRDNSDSSGGLHDYLQKQYAPVRSRSERIRQSEEYKVFSQKFDSCTTMLHTALNDCILRAKKLETDKLLAGTLDLFASHTTTLPCSTCSITYGRSTIRLTHTASTSPLSPACSELARFFGGCPEHTDSLRSFTRYREIPDSCQHHRQAGQADFRRV